MSQKIIPTLTEFQYNNLMRIASNAQTTFACLDPETPGGHTHVQELEELIPMGLLTDVSELFKEKIATFREVYKRGYKVFSLTSLAIQMFKVSEVRLPS